MNATDATKQLAENELQIRLEGDVTLDDWGEYIKNTVECLQRIETAHTGEPPKITWKIGLSGELVFPPDSAPLLQQEMTTEKTP